MLNNDIIQWISVLDTNQENLGNHKICPFANTAKYKIIECDMNDVSIHNENVELVIFKVGDDVEFEQMSEYCKNLNKIQEEYVFLPDHRHRNTYINGVQTNNGKHNLILCQSRTKLLKARAGLMKTNYYSFWNEEYLHEILGE